MAPRASARACRPAAKRADHDHGGQAPELQAPDRPADPGVAKHGGGAFGDAPEVVANAGRPGMTPGSPARSPHSLTHRGPPPGRRRRPPARSASRGRWAPGPSSDRSCALLNSSSGELLAPSMMGARGGGTPPRSGNVGARRRGSRAGVAATFSDGNESSRSDPTASVRGLEFPKRSPAPAACEVAPLVRRRDRPRAARGEGEGRRSPESPYERSTWLLRRRRNRRRSRRA